MPKLVKRSADEPKGAKVRCVEPQGQGRKRHCHWPGCGRQVPPATWGCYPHWMRLPKSLRDAVWAAYRPGQEKTMTPSMEYVKVARQVQAWIFDNWSHRDEGVRLALAELRADGKVGCELMDSMPGNGLNGNGVIHPANPFVVVPSSQEKPRAERLAINLLDLDRAEEGMRLRIARNVLRSPIHVDKNEDDEVAVEFSCPLLEACLMCDLIRSRDRRMGQPLTRAYLNKHGSWTRIPDKAVLTWKPVANRPSMLNPKAFVDAVEVVQGPPPSKAVDLSGVRSARKRIGLARSQQRE